MNVSPRTLTLSAALVLVAASVAGALVVDTDFGGGIAATGALMLVNLLLWTATVKGLFAASLAGRAPVIPAVLYSLKLLVLAAGLGLLCSLFPPTSVVIGASVVVFGILGHAAVGMGTELQVGEG